MYKEYPTFIQPHEEVKVWRYMDFTKLVSLIDSQCLYFTRADRFDDRFEGALPKANVTARKIVFEQFPETVREAILKSGRSEGITNKHWTRYNAINCWHMNDYESAAMWKLYLKSPVLYLEFLKLFKSPFYVSNRNRA